jgi:hypothetical protein
MEVEWVCDGEDGLFRLSSALRKNSRGGDVVGR